VVTGAGSGIGRATSLALAGLGALVVAVDLDATAAKQTAADCGGEAYGADVADAAEMAALADTVEATHGPVDVLVNNAGVGMSGRFLDTTLEDWDWILGVNLRGVIHGCRAFGPRMVARGRGHVVNVSSALAYLPRASEPAYVTTKAAVLSLSRCLRADWASQGVGISVVCPGVIATPIIEHTRFRGAQARPENVERLRRTFARRGHPPGVVARAVVDAISRNRAVVPVGTEAWVGWLLRRVVPVRVEDRITALGTGDRPSWRHMSTGRPAGDTSDPPEETSDTADNARGGTERRQP
jgi:NAD(P)-dependent dehydrogenase (short-subunit alcohol dehydrogenase family)